MCADLLYSAGMIDETAIGERYRALAGELDERRRRLWAAAAARATGMAENTIRRGLRELETGERLEPGRVRRPGAGRTPVTTADPTLRADLERLVDTQSRGDPESPLRWTAKSVRRLRDELRTGGHRVSHETVARLLRGLGYSLQANRKVREGTAHPDRDAQFQHLNTTATRALDALEPVISVDTKKKELVGDAQERRAGMAPQGLTRAGPGARRRRTRGTARRFPMASLTWRPKRAGCRSASTMTRPSLRSTLSAVGGSTSAGSATRTPAR